MKKFLTGKRADKLMSLSAAAGTRLAPPRGTNDDQECGVRFDYGEITERDGSKVRQVKVQPNKGAKNPTINALAKQDSHQVLAEAYVKLENTNSGDASKQLEADLKADAERKDAEKEAKKQQPKKGGKK